MRTVLTFGIMLGLVMWAPAANAAPVDVTLFSDANGEVVSISLLGKANCVSNNAIDDPCLAASAGNDANAPCSYSANGCGIAVSGTGNSLGVVSLSGTGTATGLVSLSGSNQCRSYDSTTPSQCFAVAPSGDSNGYWLSVAPEGSAQGTWVTVSPGGASSSDMIAVSGTGPASGWILAASGTGSSTSFWLAVSGTGTSTSSRIGASLTGDASSCTFAEACLAIAPLGAADGATPVGLGTCNARQCFAVVPVGDADAYWLALAGTGSATAHWAAVSVFGDAYATVAASLKDVLCNPDAVCIRP